MPKHIEDEAIRRAIGGRLRDARSAKGWSQERLAEVLGLEAVTVSRLETGRRSLTAGAAVRAAEALGINVAVLLGVTESPPAGEDEAVHLLRQLPERRREFALRFLRDLTRL